MPKFMEYTLGLYVIAMFFFLLYLLVKIWPLPADPTKPDQQLLPAQFFWGGGGEIPLEIRLILIAAVAGGIGSYVHIATSFTDFAGAETLTANWGWWYALRPFIGMSLAEVVYIALRGGFLSAGGNANPAGAISPYGVAAMASLTGLFSKQATDKLKEVFDTLFRTQQQVDRKDALPQTPSPPPSKASAAGA